MAGTFGMIAVPSEAPGFCGFTVRAGSTGTGSGFGIADEEVVLAEHPPGQLVEDPPHLGVVVRRVDRGVHGLAGRDVALEQLLGGREQHVQVVVARQVGDLARRMYQYIVPIC